MAEGLLDFIKTPEGQGLLSAAFGGLAGARRGQPFNSIGRAGLAGLTGYADATDRKEALDYKNLQMQALNEQIASSKRKNELLNNILGGFGAAAPDAASAALAAGAAAGSIGPTVANAQRLSATPAGSGSFLSSLSPDKLAALKLGAGVDLTDVYKLTQPNWMNIEGNLVNTNAPGFQGGQQRRLVVSQNGQATEAVPDGNGGVTIQAPRGALETYRGYKQADAEIASSNELVEVVGADGAKRYVTKSAVLKPPVPAAQQGDGMPMGAFKGDPAQVRSVINGIKDPYERARAAMALESQLRGGSLPAMPSSPVAPVSGPGGFQSTPTTAQEAERTRAVQQATAEGRGAGERNVESAKKTDKATEMVQNLQRARTLLEMNPTESLVGAGVDKALGAFGVATNGGQSASALEALSGWLVANVPRMEGPQSNYDVQNYMTMAGKVGDRTIPVKDRIAALNEVERIQRKYAGQPDQAAPAQPNVVDQLPKRAAKGARARDLSTGRVMVFDGMRWKPE